MTSEYQVHLGTWTNWSRGSSTTGATLTTTRAQGDLDCFHGFSHPLRGLTVVEGILSHPAQILFNRELPGCHTPPASSTPPKLVRPEFWVTIHLSACMGVAQLQNGLFYQNPTCHHSSRSNDNCVHRRRRLFFPHFHFRW